MLTSTLRNSTLAAPILSSLPFAVHAMVSQALACFTASMPACTMPAAPNAARASWITTAAIWPTPVGVAARNAEVTSAMMNAATMPAISGR